jgi:hypothetical protein
MTWHSPIAAKPDEALARNCGQCEQAASQRVGRPKTEGQPDICRDVGTGQIEADGCPRSEQTRRNAILRGRLWVSNFLYRHDVLYGSLLELRNSCHRIHSLWKQGCIRPAEIGPVYQQSPVPGLLVRNTQSQGRSLGIQKLLSDSPWMTAEDCAIFLLGWDKAEEWRARDPCDMEHSTLCSQS